MPLPPYYFAQGIRNIDVRSGLHLDFCTFFRVDLKDKSPDVRGFLSVSILANGGELNRHFCEFD